LSKRSQAELLLILVTFIWGATFVIVKEALKDASPLVFIAGRFTLAGLLLFLTLGWRKLNLRCLGPAAVLGALLFLGYIFQTAGLIYTTPSKSAFITGFSVILVPVIMPLAGVRLRPGSAAGALLGLAGIYLLVSPSGSRGINRGDWLTLVGAIAFAAYIVMVGVYARSYSFVQLAPAQILIAGILAYAALPFDPHPYLNFTPGLAGAVSVTAVFATAFAFGVQNWAQRYVPAAHAALIFALEPVFAALTSFWVMNERLGTRLLIGSAFILAGMVASETWGDGEAHPRIGT
jgi:drug/metabolite transporter (DMT)-like permease